MRDITTVQTSSAQKEESQLDFYATINEDMTPHITLFGSMHMLGEKNLIWGEVGAGVSKSNQKKRRHVGFMSLVDRKKVFFGKADYIESKSSGPELDALNQIPQIRYNCYSGFKPVHILAIVSMDQKVFDSKKFEKSAEDTKFAVNKIGEGKDADAISYVTREIIDTQNGIKILSYIDDTGYPAMVLLPQATLATHSNRIAFDLAAGGQELSGVKEGSAIAIYALSYKNMCGVLANGILKKKPIDGKMFGFMDVEKVYNPIMPVPMYVYPKPQLKSAHFEDALYQYNV